MDANSLFEGKQIDFMQKQKQYVNTFILSWEESRVDAEKSREYFWTDGNAAEN